MNTTVGKYFLAGGVWFSSCIGTFSEPLPGGTLNPMVVPKYQEALVIPPVQPAVSKSSTLSTYKIGVSQFDQQILPLGFPKTTVWGYGNKNGPAPGNPGSTYNYPAFTMEVKRNEKVRVFWSNDLVAENNHFLPHLLAVDQTIHWANPANMGHGMGHGMDMAMPYIGPVPIVTHVHGAHVADHSDGRPEAWYLPNANDIPAEMSPMGSTFTTQLPVENGTAVYDYTNDQRGSTLWYHDHTLGMTRLNVYAGLAGFWIVRDPKEDRLNLPGPAPQPGDAPGIKYYEIPLAIQDKSFNEDGSLFYPSSREFFDGTTQVYPQNDVPPIWNPEFFGNTMLVNGRTWPYLNVDQHRYRLRLLDGCNSRFLILKFETDNGQTVPFYQIGNEGGLLPKQVRLTQILLAPGERADIIVSFDLPLGTTVRLKNIGPDEPYKGSTTAFEPADAHTTGQVMEFRVTGRVIKDPSANPARSGGIALPSIKMPGSSIKTRDLTLNEMMNIELDVPIGAFLGTAEKGPLMWDDSITELPRLGTTESWRFINLTADAHPIHLHLVTFQLLGRVSFNAEAYAVAQEAYLNNRGPKPILERFYTGPILPPNSNERGYKDTFIAEPGQVSIIKAKFDMLGNYVWHCHIVEHEDNEMMRPFVVVP